MDNTILFPTETIKNTFLSALAYRKMHKNKKSFELCNDELNEFVQNCGKILDENNARMNFVEEIIRLNNIINDENETAKLSNLADVKSERDSLIQELTDFINMLKSNPSTLSLGEDLERDSNRAFDRQKRILLLKQDDKTLQETYPGHQNVDIENLLSGYPFSDISTMVIKNPTDNLIQEPTETLPRVVSVTDGSELVSKLTGEKTSESLNENSDVVARTDNRFFEVGDELGEKIENGFEEDLIGVIEPETTSFDDFTIPITDDKRSIIEDTPVSVISEEPTVSDTESLEFKLEEGITLSAVAENAYYDKTQWKALYEYNKDTIDSILTSLGLTIEEAKDNPTALKGLTIKVPLTLTPKTIEYKKVA